MRTHTLVGAKIRPTEACRVTNFLRDTDPTLRVWYDHLRDSGVHAAIIQTPRGVAVYRHPPVRLRPEP